MNLFKYLSGSNFRIYNLEIAELVSVNASIVLGWLSYVAEKHNSNEIFTTYENISNYTKLTDNEIRSSLNKLVNCGYITIVKKGIPAKNYYTIQEVQIFSDLKSISLVLEKVDDKGSKNLMTGVQENEGHIKNTNINTKKNSNNNNEFLEIFDIFRKEYLKHNKSPRGNQTEFDNFKRHKDWKTEIHKLLPTLKSEILHRQANDKMKYMHNLKTWINNRQWEVDYGNTIDSIKPIIPKGIYEAMGTSMTKEEFLKMGKND